MTRRHFLALAATPAFARSNPRPNVILIISDDQGYGDLSIHGNPHLKTPNIDQIARQGAQFTQFQVCPVCSPTRASLMTGRYNYRTGVVDTFRGRSLMDPRETTAAELFAKAGYKTGIFGKWHLGDNYPMRAHDKGFQETLVHGGGGLAQPSDPPPGNHYFNPTLLRDGKFEKVEGYCTDIFFREAIGFIQRHKAKPFFLYIPTNAPHAPLEIDEKYVAPFKNKGLDETTQKVYGMVANLDENIGRLLETLKQTNLESNTILIFMTDNGPQQRRYNAGMRGLKTTPYQGGIRVPFFLRWPNKIKPGATIGQIAAHIDVLPTLLEACQIRPAKTPQFDGLSLWPLLQSPSAPWPDRVIHTQWHRGDQPVLFKNHAARSQRWKLVNGTELYDLENDPAESKNLAAANPAELARLRAETERWFKDVSATRNGYAPPRIYLGTTHENPVLLTRQDRRDDPPGWEVDVRQAARYQVVLFCAPAKQAGEAVLKLGTVEGRVPLPLGAERVTLEALRLPAGPAHLSATAGTSEVLYVEVRKLNG